jgi:hypothetical protein
MYPVIASAMYMDVQVPREAWMLGAASEALSRYGISQLEIASSLRSSQ